MSSNVDGDQRRDIFDASWLFLKELFNLIIFLETKRKSWFQTLNVLCVKMSSCPSRFVNYEQNNGRKFQSALGFSQRSSKCLL